MEGVHAHHDLLLVLHRLLEFVSCVLDLGLHIALFDGLQRPAHLVDPVQVFLGASLDLVGQIFHHIRTCHRIDRIGCPGFVGDDLLCAQRHAHRLLGR